MLFEIMMINYFKPVAKEHNDLSEITVETSKIGTLKHRQKRVTHFPNVERVPVDIPD